MNLYLDITGGVSEDMIFSALLGLGADYDRFMKEMATLSIRDEFEMRLSQTSKGAIGEAKADVILKEDKPFVHRNLGDVVDIIESSGIAKIAKDMAKNIFTVLEEAKGHTTEFHEVVSTEVIVRIIGTAVLVDMLGIESVYCSEIQLGNKVVNSKNLSTTLTLNLLEDMNVRFTNRQSEIITPAGVAILKGLKTRQIPNLSMKIKKSFVVYGSEDFDIPNVLIAILFEEDKDYIREKLVVLSCNLDDMTGEFMGNAMEELFDAGALDVWFSPIFMKKNRPAYKLEVLTDINLKETISKIIFEQTTTLGIREKIVDRTSLQRKFRYQDTEFGRIRVKEAYIGNRKIKEKAEFEDIKALAKGKR